MFVAVLTFSLSLANFYIDEDDFEGSGDDFGKTAKVKNLADDLFSVAAFGESASEDEPVYAPDEDNFPASDNTSHKKDQISAVKSKDEKKKATLKKNTKTSAPADEEEDFMKPSKPSKAAKTVSTAKGSAVKTAPTRTTSNIESTDVKENLSLSTIRRPALSSKAASLSTGPSVASSLAPGLAKIRVGLSKRSAVARAISPVKIKKFD